MRVVTVHLVVPTDWPDETADYVAETLRDLNFVDWGYAKGGKPGNRKPVAEPFSYEEGEFYGIWGLEEPGADPVDDPSWGLGDDHGMTTGFEAHLEELLAFRLEKEAEWKTIRKNQALRRATDLTRRAEESGFSDLDIGRAAILIKDAIRDLGPQ